MIRMRSRIGIRTTSRTRLRIRSSFRIKIRISVRIEKIGVMTSQATSWGRRGEYNQGGSTFITAKVKD